MSDLKYKTVEELQELEKWAEARMKSIQSNLNAETQRLEQIRGDTTS